MRYNVANEVMQARVGSPTKKAILLYFAARCSDSGGDVWASKARMARELEMDRSTLFRAIKAMVEDGILVEEGERKCATGSTFVYRINLPLLRTLCEEPREDEREASPFGKPGNDPVHSAHPTLGAAPTHPVHSAHQTSLEHPLDHSVPNGTGAGAPQGASQDFDLSKVLFSEGLRFLAQNGVPEGKARSMLGKWRKDHRDGEILDAIADCQRANVIDPVPWIVKRLQPKAAQGYDWDAYHRGRGIRGTGGRAGRPRACGQLAGLHPRRAARREPVENHPRLADGKRTGQVLRQDQGEDGHRQRIRRGRAPARGVLRRGPVWAGLR